MVTVDLDAVQLRLGPLVDRFRPGAEVRAVTPLVGGRSSLTYRVTLDRGGDDPTAIVVKMAPPGLEPVRNRDVLRQARVQDAISRAGGAPVARVLFTEAGAPPAVPPLYAMEFLEGESFEPVLDECEVLPEPAQLRGRQLDAARILGGLHAVHPTTMGLDDEPEVPLDEEVLRW